MAAFLSLSPKALRCLARLDKEEMGGQGDGACARGHKLPHFIVQRARPKKFQGVGAAAGARKTAAGGHIARRLHSPQV